MDLEKILKYKVIPSMRRTLVTVNEFTFPDTYWAVKEQIGTLEINEEDVWISTFPKSGTTWTQEMVWMIINNLDFEKGKQPLGARSPFLEFTAIATLRQVLEENPHLPIRYQDYDSISHVKSLKSPSLIKTHLPLQLLPNQIKNGIKKLKMIYVARDPKDACVSYYHHARLLEGFTGTLDEFCELFLAGKYPYLPYWKHVLPFWNIKDSPNLMFLKYKDMKKDLRTVIKAVAKFLEHPLNDEKIEILAKHLSFESMKKNPSLNLEELTSTLKNCKLTEYEDGHFLRSGIVGDHKNYMSSDYVQRFDEWIKVNTEGTDYVV